MNLKNVVRILATKFECEVDSNVTKQKEDYADQLYNLILSRVTIKTNTDLDFNYENEKQTPFR